MPGLRLEDFHRSSMTFSPRGSHDEPGYPPHQRNDWAVIWIPGSQPIPLHPKFGSHPKRLKPAGTRIPGERAKPPNGGPADQDGHMMDRKRRSETMFAHACRVHCTHIRVHCWSTLLKPADYRHMLATTSLAQVNIDTRWSRMRACHDIDR
jgi:hypothetical protein